MHPGALADRVRTMQDELLAIMGEGIDTGASLLPVSDEADGLDAIATGINILLQELRYEVRAQRLLNDELDRIFETLTDALLVLDRHGTVMRVNAAGETLFGSTAEQLRGRSIAALYASPPRAQALLSRLRGQSVVQDFEARCRHTDGTVTEVAVSASLLHGSGPVGDTNAQPLEPAIVWVASDVSELKRLLKTAATANSERERAAALAKAHRELAATHQELRATHDQLLHVQKTEAIGQLAGGIAHDFNNLLLVILSGAELVQSQVADDPASSEEIQAVIAAAKRAAALTRGLLALSRKPTSDDPVVSTNEVVASMTAMLRRLVGGHIRWETTLADDLWLTKVDPSALEQVVVNLVVNARDAMPGGGVLRVETCNRRLERANELADLAIPAGDYMQLLVADSGHGMSIETQRRVFEPFFTTKPRSDGTGLGLSTCSGIVTQAGGTIVVQSEVDSGTTFRVLLPRTDAESTVVAAVTAVGAPKRKDRRSILVAEDEPAVCRMIVRTLEHHGYRVTPAADGREAIAQYRATTDLVISDLMMPHMGGLELGRSLQQRSPDVKILYMTGYSDCAPDLVAGRTALLPKPFTSTQLLTAIGALLGAEP